MHLDSLGRLILLVVLLVSLAVPTWATTRFLDQNPGSNCAGNYSIANRTCTGSDGTSYTDYATAVGSTACGDTLYVRAGTYSFAAGYYVNYRQGNCASATTTTTYAGDTRATLKWSGTFNTSDQIDLYSGNLTGIPTANLVFSNLELTGANLCLHMEGVTRITVTQMWIHDCGQGIIGSSFNSTFTRNTINHIGNFAGCASTPSICNGDHGIYLMGSNNLVANNLIYDNLGYGIQVDDAVLPGQCNAVSTSYCTSSNNLFLNNTIAYENYRAGMVLWNNGGGGSGNRVENTIFYNNCQHTTYPNGTTNSNCGVGQSTGFAYCNTVTGYTLTNNVAFGVVSTALTGVDCAPASCTGCTITSNLVQDPKLVTSSSTVVPSPDFHLTAPSPAIGFGLNLTACGVIVDYAGSPRPTGSGTCASPTGTAWDSGAYVFQGLIGPGPPTNLTVQ